MTRGSWPAVAGLAAHHLDEALSELEIVARIGQAGRE